MDTLFVSLVIIGIFASFVGTLAGGGGIITLPAMLLVGIPIHTGIATNKFSSGFASFTSVVFLYKSKKLTLKEIAIYVLLACIGGVIGALVTASLTESTMNIIAFLLLSFTFVITLNNKQWVAAVDKGKDQDKGPTKTSWASRVIPFLIAIYDGGFGPGSSTFNIVYFLQKRETYVKAAHLSRALNLGSCIGAFTVFYYTGFVQWEYAISLAVGSAIGSQVGLLALPRVPIKLARTLVMTITVLLMGQVLFKMM